MSGAGEHRVEEAGDVSRSTRARGKRALTMFTGRADDHNDRAMSGARALGERMAHRLGLDAAVLGTLRPALSTDWRTELDEALPELRELGARLGHVLGSGAVPVTALNRCAAALATVPAVLRHRPDACVLWLDAHADLNTPDTTPSGYLGGLALSGPAGLWDSGSCDEVRMITIQVRMY